MRLKVAVLVGTWPSPSETFLARDLAALPAHGLDVVVAALQPGPDGPADGVLYRARAASQDSPPATLRPWETPAVSAGLSPPPLLLARTLRNLPFAWRLAAWCQDEQVDLLHAAWGGLPAQLAWVARALGGPAYTIGAHARDVFGPPESARAAWLAARGVTVCNRAAEQAVRQRLPELGPRLVCLPHGLPLADWPARAGEPVGPPVVLAVGRLVRKKGFDTLLAALARQPAALEVIGDGPEAGALHAQAAALGVAVTWHGQQPVTAVRAALERATLLVLPSRVDHDGDRDGLANVLLEALAVGVPVITTPAGSATDLIAPGRTGWLVPPDSPGALAAALGELLGDAARRRRLAAAGRMTITRHWSLERTGAQLAAWLRARAEGHQV